jgi:hypothetical protein
MGDDASLPAAGYLPVADSPAVCCLPGGDDLPVDGHWRAGDSPVDDLPGDDLPVDERSDSKAG